MISWAIFFVSFFVYSDDYPFYQANPSYHLISQSEFRVSAVTPIRSQDGIGICYGFSATLILEQFRCKEMHLNCLDPKNFMSPLDISSYDSSSGVERKIFKGGDTYSILKNLDNSDHRIVREDCAPMSSLLLGLSDEKAGWDFLALKWKEYQGLSDNKKNKDCASCVAEEIKERLGPLILPVTEIMTALNKARTIEDFYFQTLISKKCFQSENQLSIPRFIVKTYPQVDAESGVKDISQKIYELIRNNIPVQLPICLWERNDECPQDQRHSIVLTGIREECSEALKRCELMALVQNSYGRSWQNAHREGWVQLTPLIQSSKKLLDLHFIRWIENPSMTKTSFRYSPNREWTLPLTNDKNIIKKPAMWKCKGATFQDFYSEGCTPL